MKKYLFIILVLLVIPTVVKASENIEVKYYKTVIDKINNISYIKEITQEEYDNVNGISLFSTNHETEYKKIIIKNNSNKINLTVEWKKNPAVRSFDVIALRGVGVTFDYDSINGIQDYYLNNSKSSIFYNSTSENVKLFSNGFGVSMNLVNGASNYSLSLSINYFKDINNGTVYGTYQHSQRDISLSQSQRYTISANGYGGVLDFDSSVEDYFDGMGGVSINV